MCGTHTWMLAENPLQRILFTRESRCKCDICALIVFDESFGAYVFRTNVRFSMRRLERGTSNVENIKIKSYRVCVAVHVYTRSRLFPYRRKYRMLLHAIGI